MSLSLPIIQTGARVAVLQSGGAVPFTPLALPGLVGWWRADSGVYQDAARTVPAVADADPVGGWADLSGAGNHLAQATASKRPTLKLAIVNDRSVIRMDAVDDWLSGPCTGGATQTVFLVATKRTPPDAANRALYGYTGSAMVYTNSLDHLTDWLWYSPFKVLSGAAANAWTIARLSLTSASALVLAVNGTTVVASFDPHDTVMNTTHVLGASTTSGGMEGGEFDLAEIIHYSRTLTAPEAQPVEQYLGQRYDVAVA